MIEIPYRVVGLQAAVTVLVALIALGWGAEAMKGALIGGIAGFVPNLYFAWSAMRLGNLAPMSAGAGILGRWVTKVVMTVALVAIAIGVLKVGGLAFFITFSVVLLVPMLAPLMQGPKVERESEASGEDRRDEYGNE